jgi:uncharacterized repeat protein (TIGR01451 family)
MMITDKNQSNRGQALVEFALIAGVLLLLIFIIVESGRMFQAWQTVQNAARSAGRYAITGQFDASCFSNLPPCDDPRVHSIKEQARQAAAGLAIDESVGPNQPGYFNTTVLGYKSDGSLCGPDCAGDPGQPVLVNVTYRLPIIIPVIQAIIPSLRVRGQIVMYNENYDQFSNTTVQIVAPQFPMPLVDPAADLFVTKTAVPTAIVAVNGSIEYTLQVRNNGPNAARGVKVIDTLPDGVTDVGTYIDPNLYPFVSCTLADGTITCVSSEDIPKDYTFEVVINVNAPATAGTITNTVEVSGVFNDPNLGNNIDSVQHLVTEDEDVVWLQLESIIAFPSPVIVDDRLRYDIVVRNHGIVTASGVEIVSQLPPAVDYVDASETCNLSGDVLTCSLANLPVGQTASMFVEVDAPATPQMLEYTATVTADQPNPGEPQDIHTKTIETEVAPRHTDLSVTIFDDPDPVLVEERLTYFVQAVNNGPAPATAVTVTGTVAPNSVASIDVLQGNCTVVGQVLTCDVGALANGGSALIIVEVTPTEVGTIVAQVEISGVEVDPNPDNNVAQQVTDVIPSADLAITKTASAEPVEGKPMFYTLAVTNHGPSDATGATVIDDLPTGVNFVSAVINEGDSCGLSGSTVTCYIGDMAAGSDVTITIQVVPLVADNIVNMAEVAANQTDPNPGNDSDQISTQVGTTSAHYIFLDKTCGEPGDTVVIEGRNWPTQGNPTYTVSWLPADTPLTPDPPIPNQTSWTTSVTVPVAPGGIHQIRVTRTQVQNTHNAFAYFTIPCAAPDLVIGDLELVSSTPITTHEAVTFEAVITNDGNLPAVDQFFVSLYFNPDPAPDIGSSTHISADYRVAVVGISGLGAGQSKTVSLTADNGFPITGTHSVYAVVDSDPGPTGVIDERFETNNIAGPLDVPVENEATPPDDPPPPEETGSLSGTATISGQQSPQALVRVRATHLDSGTLFEVYTDMAGEYDFADLPVGEYTITGCFVEGDIEYFTSVTGVDIIENQTTTRHLILEQTPCT